MDVGNLLELERTLQRDRVVDAAAEIEEVARLAILARHALDLALALFQHFLDLRRDREGRLEHRVDFAFAEPAQARGEMDREQIEGFDLRQEALGGGDAYFGAAAGIELRVGLARDRGIDGVGDGE